MEKKYTIKDIAEMAGVSKGTVDRVIHKRGKVSEKAHEKISKILQEINFSPNPIAKSLKSNKTYIIGILIPSIDEDLYWKPCIEAINLITSEYQSFQLQLNLKEYDQHSPKSFITASEELLDSNIDALVFVPLFNRESKLLLEKCSSKNILIATFNNFISNTNIHLQIGQNLKSSGRAAANLMHQINTCNHIAILHLDENLKNATHMQEKESGFRSYFDDKTDLNTKISTFNIQFFNEKEIEKSIAQILQTHSDICGFYVTTSKAYLVIPAIPAAKNIKVIGYDLLQRNIDYLKADKIQFLINQNPKLQLYKSLALLIEKLIFNKEFKKELYLPIEIITSENYKEYLD